MISAGWYGASGVAEFHPFTETVEGGDVVVADRVRAGWMQKGTWAGDPAVVGIVVENPAVMTSEKVMDVAVVDPLLVKAYSAALAAGNDEEADALFEEMEKVFSGIFASVALAGTVTCKADASYGAIQVGDLLTTSPTPGHAMRAQSFQRERSLARRWNLWRAAKPASGCSRCCGSFLSVFAIPLIPLPLHPAQCCRWSAG